MIGPAAPDHNAGTRPECDTATMGDARPRRFQLSIRTLMLSCVVVAILLVPVAWVARERQQMQRLQDQILMAREAALRSVIREEEARKKQAVDRAAFGSLDDLRRENAALRARVEELNEELRMVRTRAGTAPPNGR